MSLLSQIETQPKILPPRIVIHGDAGVGKTTFAASVPGVVFIPAEEGEGNLVYAKFPKPETHEDVLAAIKSLLEDEHEYRALCIDSIDQVEPLVWDAVCRDANKGYSNIEDFGWGKGYKHADNYWIDLFRGLDSLRRERKMLTLVIAHSKTTNIDDPTVGPYTKWSTKIHDRANALMYEWADVVGFARVQRVSQEKEGTKGKKLETSTSSGRRELCLEDMGGFVAKNRYQLPPRMDLSWDVLRAAITESFKQPEKKKGKDAAA